MNCHCLSSGALFTFRSSFFQDVCSTVIQKLLLNIIPPPFIYFFLISSLWNLIMMRNVWVELPPRPTRAESQSPRLFQPGKAQRWEKPQEIERTFPQGFSRYHSWQPAWLWWKEICVIQNNNKLQVEPSLKEKGTIVKKKKLKNHTSELVFVQFICYSFWNL